MSTSAKGAAPTKREIKEKRLRDLAIAGNALGRHAHTDDGIKNLCDKVWKLHGKLSK